MKKCQGCNKKIKNALTFCPKCSDIEKQNENEETAQKKVYLKIIVSFK